MKMKMKKTMMIMTKERLYTFIQLIGLILIIITVIGIVICLPDNNKIDEIKKYENKQDSLKQIINYYKNLDQNHNKKIIQLTDSIAYLNALLEYNEQELNSLKKRRYAKNINISKYSTTDIKKFWSDRYKDSLQSK